MKRAEDNRFIILLSVSIVCILAKCVESSESASACRMLFTEPNSGDRQYCDNNRGCWYMRIFSYNNITCKNWISIRDSPNICPYERCSITFTEIEDKILHTNTFVDITPLEQIFLNNSNIQIIKKHPFVDLPNIFRIDLGNNNISEISDDIFKPLHSLKILNLNNNQIKTISVDAFEGCVSLEILDLSFNKLIVVQETLRPLYRSLNILNISNNPLEMIEESFCSEFTSLKVLEMNKNNISELPNCSNNVNLEILSLRENSLTSLEDSNFPISLKRLSVGENSIKTLTKHIFSNLTKLEQLDISANSIESLPYGIFRNSSNLTILDISQNRITDLESIDFQGLTKLKFLNYSFNRLQHVKVHAFLPMSDNLTELDLTGNLIEFIDIDDMLIALPLLEELKIDKNQISCNDLGKIIARSRKNISKNEIARNVLIISSGTTSNGPNVNGVACRKANKYNQNQNSIDQSNPKREDSSLQNFLQNDFEKTPFYNFFMHFNKGSKDYDLQIENGVVSKNLTSEIHNLIESENVLRQKLIESENEFHRNFLAILNKTFSAKLETVGTVEKKQFAENEMEINHHQSSQHLLREMSDLLNNESKREKYENSNKINNKIETAAALMNNENATIEEMRKDLKEMKLFFVLCLMILITFCVVKSVKYIKHNHKKENIHDGEQQDIPFLVR